MRVLLALLPGIFLTSFAIAQVPTLEQDLNTGTASGMPTNFITFNGKLFFFALDAHQRELWSKDFGISNSAMIADANTSGDGALFNTMANCSIVYNGKLYYKGGISGNADKIMVYDGTNPPSIAPNCAAYPGTGFSDPIILNNMMYFLANTTGSSGTGPSLYSYDGINTPVLLVSNLGARSRIQYRQVSLIDYKGKLYFNNDSSTTGPELYEYDPATNKKSLVANIRPSVTGGDPGEFVKGGNTLYFEAYDSVLLAQLYSYDGSTVKRLTNSVTGGFKNISFATGQQMMAFHKGAIFFKGEDASSHAALYKYDTATHTVSLVKDINPTGDPVIDQLVSTGKNLYFFARTVASGDELWRYEGATCTMVADLNPGSVAGIYPTNICFTTGSKGAIYFNGNNGSTGFEIYKLDDFASGSSIAIQNPGWSGELQVYPNPATTTATLLITIKEKQSLGISVTDLTGKVVHGIPASMYQPGKTSVQIPVEDLSAGQYFFRLVSEHKGTLASGSFTRQ